MRSISFALLMLTGCSSGEERSDLRSGSFAAAGRDRLCIADEAQSRRAGLIVYDAGDGNCSASGRLERGAAGWILVPRGEGNCRISLLTTGDGYSIGKAAAACDYYCGPGASFEGQRFKREATIGTVADFAGDPLC